MDLAAEVGLGADLTRYGWGGRQCEQHEHGPGGGGPAQYMWWHRSPVIRAVR